jgi:hypothetical protein
MPSGVGDDRFATFEPVRRSIFPLGRFIDLVDAVLKEIGEATLKQFQALPRGFDGSESAVSLGYVECLVLCRRA